MAYDVTDFSDIVSAVAAELKLDSNDTAEMARIKRDINLVYRDEVVPFKRWKWLLGHTTLRQQPFISDGTVACTPNSATITFSVAPTESQTGKLFALDNFNEIYTISAHTAASTSATLSSVYTGTLQTAATYKIWSNKLALPTDARETVEIWHDHMAQPLEGLGLQDFRRRNAERPKVTGRPLSYTTYDYEDPSTGDAETESDRYRVVMFYPAIYEYSTTLHVDYIKEVSSLDADGDEPLMPIEDRIVLVYGALERAWRRQRNPEEAANNRALFERKLALMAGKVEDSQDRPQITPNSTYLARKRAKAGTTLRNGSFSAGASYTAPNYLQNARIDGATVVGNITVNNGITIDGRDISADGALLDAHIADTDDAHDASAISVVPTGNLGSDTVQEALEELQSDINAINASTGLQDHLDDTIDAHNASAVSVVPTGNLAADDVQEALEELQTDIDTVNGIIDYLDNTEALTTATLTDNTGVATSLATWAAASFDSIALSYTLKRGASNIERGILNIVTDGTSAAIAQGAIASLGTLGVTFTVDVSGGNLRLLYTTTSTGTNATIKYKVHKWLA